MSQILPYQLEPEYSSDEERSESEAEEEEDDLRFQNTLPLLGALSIFDPTLIPASSSELPSYGVDSIQVLAKHYFPDHQDRLLAEWNILNYHMKEMAIAADVKEGTTTMPAQWCMSQLMKERSSFLALLLLLMHIVEIALTMPISNAWPERGASRVKLIKTRLRSRLIVQRQILQNVTPW